MAAIPSPGIKDMLLKYGYTESEIGRWNAPHGTRYVKVAIACRDSNGVPTLYFCEVEATIPQVTVGDHYIKAAEMARADGFDVPPPNHMIAIDEQDDARVFQLASGEEWINGTNG
jgi:hypothetical protein